MINIIFGTIFVIGVGVYLALLIRDIIAYNKFVENEYKNDEGNNVQE